MIAAIYGCNVGLELPLWVWLLQGIWEIIHLCVYALVSRMSTNSMMITNSFETNHTITNFTFARSEVGVFHKAHIHINCKVNIF